MTTAECTTEALARRYADLLAKRDKTVRTTWNLAYAIPALESSIDAIAHELNSRNTSPENNS